MICTSHQQPKVDKINNNKDNNPSVSAYENHGHVVIGPSSVDKTYYKLKRLEKKGNKRPIHIITRSPNQYTNYETSNGIKPIDKNKELVVFFDDMLEARNSCQLDEVFTRDLDVYYISQCQFGSPRRSIRINSDILILFKTIIERC